jgi:hypothetical protein
VALTTPPEGGCKVTDGNGDSGKSGSGCGECREGSMIGRAGEDAVKVDKGCHKLVT